MTLVLILILNLAVGVCIGLTGIAGFLLPMFYTGFLGMPADQSLALSFSAFLISGVLGSVTYYREGNLAVRPAVILSAGSLVGAVAGVRINLLIPENVIQIVLYVVVLLSGISILLRREKKEQEREKRKTEETAGGKSVFYLLLGLVTGAVCAASGAGGPVLVMPLLTLLGFPAHTAVGMSLFNSIFIALPAAVLLMGTVFQRVAQMAIHIDQFVGLHVGDVDHLVQTFKKAPFFIIRHTVSAPSLFVCVPIP